MDSFRYTCAGNGGPAIANETYYTSKEVAASLKVTDRTVRRWIHAGLLKVTRLGRSVRIAESDLERFIALGRSE